MHSFAYLLLVESNTTFHYSTTFLEMQCYTTKPTAKLVKTSSKSTSQKNFVVRKGRGLRRNKVALAGGCLK